MAPAMSSSATGARFPVIAAQPRPSSVMRSPLRPTSRVAIGEGGFMMFASSLSKMACHLVENFQVTIHVTELVHGMGGKRHRSRAEVARGRAERLFVADGTRSRISERIVAPT